MLAMKYKQRHNDHTLFMKHSTSRGVTTLLRYVYDIPSIDNDPREKETLQQCLVREFDIKELGKLKYFLWIEVAHSKEDIFVSHQKYVINLLKETGKIRCKLVDTPIEPNHKLREALEDETIDCGMHQQLVDRFIYVAHTRPDFAYVVSIVG